MSVQDTLSVETARQVLAHNETGAALCGWRGRNMTAVAAAG